MRSLCLVAMLAGAPLAGHGAASLENAGYVGVASPADSAPAWFQRHLEELTRGSGRWTADNSAFKSREEPWDGYGLEWTWGLGRHSVKGRLYAIQDGREVGSLFEYRLLWHPGERMAMLLQYGSDGTYGQGVIQPDGTDGTMVEQTFFQPGGGTTRIKHTDHYAGEVRVVQSFEWVEGAWHPRRLYRWRRGS